MLSNRLLHAMLLLAMSLTTILPSDAGAQTSLPGVVVTSPSPVAPPKSRPAPQPKSEAAAKPAPKPAPAPAKSKAAPKTAAPASAAAGPPPPGEPAPAGPAPGIANDTFVAVSVLDAPQIVAQPQAAIGDAVAHLPGLAASTFAPGASRPIIRGLDNYRVRIQENGIASHDVSALSEDHAVPLPPMINNQIEVIRGPGTLRYGSQAIGGVVSAMNNRIPEIIPPKGISVTSSGAWGSADDGHEGALIVDMGAGNIAIHGDLWRRHAADYHTPQGIQANSRYDAEGGALGASFVGRDGFIGIGYQHYASLYHIPGIEAAERKLRIDLEHWRLAGRGEWRPQAYGVAAIRGWLGYTEYKHDEISNDPVTGEAGIGSTFKNNQTEGRIEVQHMPLLLALGSLSGAIGMQWGDRRLSASGEGGELLAPVKSDTIAAYLFEEWQVTRALRLQGAFRLESARHQGTAATFPPGYLPPPDEPELAPATRTYRPASVSFGVLYQLPLGIVARLTAQQVERAPEAGELFSKGPHEASQTFEIGDPNLSKERARTLEIGFRRANGAFRFDLAAYRTQFDGFIYKSLTGTLCDDDFASCGAGSELQQIVYSQRDATFQGVELSGELDIAPIWQGVWGFSGQYDFVDARFDDGSNVPRIPPHRAGLGIYYRDPSWRAKLWTLHAFRQDEIAANETATSSYTLLNAEIAYRWRPALLQGPLSQEMTIGIRGDNLLDDDVRNHVSFRKEEVLQPGRSIRLFGTIVFN